MTTLAEMATDFRRRMGLRIRERRLEMGHTQRSLADVMVGAPGVDAQAISKWERGFHRPSDENLDALAEALHTTPADLVAGPLAERKAEGIPELLDNHDGTQLDRIEASIRDLAEAVSLLAASMPLPADEQEGPPRAGRASA